MLFALAPALQASRIRPVDSLRGQRHGSPRGARLRHTLVVAQVASALVLVVAAITLAHNGAGMSRHDLGFDPTGVISVNVRGTDDRAARPLADALVEDPRVADLVVTSGNPLFNAAKKVAAVPGGGQQATRDRSHVRLAGVLFDASRADRSRARLHGRRGARRRAGRHRERGHGAGVLAGRGSDRQDDPRRAHGGPPSSAIFPATLPSPSSGRFAT